MIWIKVGMIAAGIFGSAFFVWDYINTKQNNAVLESSLASTTEAFGNYAYNVEQEIEGYSEAVRILGNRDIEERIKRDEQFAKIEGRDLNKMSQRKPNALNRILTGRTARMLDALTGTSKNAGSPNYASSGTP